MLDELRSGKKLVGVKQSLRAIREGKAACAYIAADASMGVTRPVSELCSETGVRLVTVETMAELGNACGIEVGAAAAVLLTAP